MSGEAISADLRRFLESKYSLVSKEEDEKIVQTLTDLMAIGTDRMQPLKTFFDRVLRFVFRQFGFTEVAIGLKERNQDVWRYEAAFGFTKEVEAELFKTRYDHDDMYTQNRFSNIKTGKLSELIVAEGLPEAETDRYDRPFRWRGKRANYEEFLPGDFLDFWMLDEKKEIIGWIEVSGPIDKKQPSRTTVRWLELLASMCSEILRCRNAE
ncbi:MAG: hypothetical protein JW880_04140 [Candidatus Thermoplasmatota archaeon]|nr:hypothetical protein [Candidatus Thermoplasmatota archaeon]